MQPFFKSIYRSIVPFNSIIGISVNSNNAIEFKLIYQTSLTLQFKDLTDKEIQLKSYENYLINQYKLKELQ